MALTLHELTTGMSLPELNRLVTQEHVNLYAEASRDFNPIHLDPEFGKKMGLGGTVAHGMLILAYLSAYMTAHFGLGWLTAGTLNIRFKAPARPGDVISITGKITSMEPDNGFTSICCDVLCHNQNNEAVIVGETKVRMP